MTGHHTLRHTEDAVASKLDDLPVDFVAMSAVSGLYRAASAIRNHLEQTVLRPAGLTWTAFVVLWVVWIWEEMETRHVAAEAGITKGTLTGITQTLTKRGLVRKSVPAADRRRAVLSLTDEGERLMRTLFPEFNAQEQQVTAVLARTEVADLGRSLHRLVEGLEHGGSPGSAADDPEAE